MSERDAVSKAYVEQVRAMADVVDEDLVDEDLRLDDVVLVMRNARARAVYHVKSDCPSITRRGVGAVRQQRLEHARLRGLHACRSCGGGPR